MSKKITITIQVPVELHRSIVQAQRNKGFPTLASFVRHTLEHHAPVERAVGESLKQRVSESKARALAALAAPKEAEKPFHARHDKESVERRRRVRARVEALRRKNTPNISLTEVYKK